jgi:hypothetical protein
VEEEAPLKGQSLRRANFAAISSKRKLRGPPRSRSCVGTRNKALPSQMCVCPPVLAAAAPRCAFRPFFFRPSLVPRYLAASTITENDSANFSMLIARMFQMPRRVALWSGGAMRQATSTSPIDP